MSKHLRVEVEKLKKKLLALSAVVEEQVERAVTAVQQRNEGVAQQVIEKDLEIDHSEVEVEEECLKILALHQPVAIDLRFIVAALKLNNDLERIGDLAVNIAERALFLSRVTPPVIPFDFNEMAQRTRDMLKQSLDALVNMDIELARRVCAEDDEVDRINREMYVHVKQAIRQHPHHLEALVHLLSVSRHLERIADHTTNIAEDVIYMIEGEIVRHKTEDFEHDLAADMEH